MGVVFHRYVYCNSEEEFQEIIDRINAPASKETIEKIRKNFEKSRNSNIKIERACEEDN